MVRMRSWIVFGLLVSVLAVCVPLRAQEPCTITVGPGESIQAAIDAAPEGAVICLSPGVWRENLTISKNLTLQGKTAAESVIQGKGWDRPILRIVEPAGVVLVQNLTVTGGQNVWGNGLIVEGTVLARVSKCVFTANDSHGLVFIEQAEGVVSDCTFFANKRYGLLLAHSSHAVVIDCVSHGNQWGGIGLENDARAEIIGCTVFSNTPNGVVTVKNSRLRILACDIYENGMIGILCKESSQATVLRCTICRNKTDGIQVAGSAQVTVNHCAISQNVRQGITLLDTSQSSIDNNEILENGAHGVALGEQPCFNRDDSFAGLITGRSNRITGNVLGLGCPASQLEFLGTQSGGKLDRRE